MRHKEPAYAFEFTTCLGAGHGYLRHSPFRNKWSRHYCQANLSAGQLCVLGVGLLGDGSPERLRALASLSPVEHLSSTSATLDTIQLPGRTSGGTGDALHSFRDFLVRSLHSMIDDSGAFRASLKAIYYLIWVRDAGFAFAYQSAAGWPHKLPELCRLLLDNPTDARGEGIPPGKMFAQLINRDYGKYEEDGIYYVLWTIFTHWTQHGSMGTVGTADKKLLRDAMAWVEAYCFDSSKGLFGGYFADETPAFLSRDYAWDFAIGKPAGDEHIRHDGHRVLRSYDIYLNTLMHSAYCMLGALHADESLAEEYTAKAQHLWQRLEPLYADRKDGLPAYGDLLCEDDVVRRAFYWGPASSTYIWALSMPNFLPLQDRDAVSDALLNALLRKPKMHWINGICAAIAAVDPWVYGEQRLLQVLKMIHAEAQQPGTFLPMGGAMPEKLGAPQGNLYHDIRPQGFAMAAWLGAWASLGVRRLPYGLAVRPTAAYSTLQSYPWRKATVHFNFQVEDAPLELRVDGLPVAHTLQLPQDLLSPGEHQIALRGSQPSSEPLWLRSTVCLHAVAASPQSISYSCSAYGLSEIVISHCPDSCRLIAENGTELEIEKDKHPKGVVLRFHHIGKVDLLLVKA